MLRGAERGPDFNAIQSVRGEQLSDRTHRSRHAFFDARPSCEYDDRSHRIREHSARRRADRLVPLFIFNCPCSSSSPREKAETSVRRNAERAAKLATLYAVLLGLPWSIMVVRHLGECCPPPGTFAGRAGCGHVSEREHLAVGRPRSGIQLYVRHPDPERSEVLFPRRSERLLVPWRARHQLLGLPGRSH